nr:zinc-ribbon domain-containing protein [Companilactobacillus sp.]
MSEKTLFCPNCGTKVTSGDVFCPNCGFDLRKFNASYDDGSKSANPQPAPQNPSNNQSAKSAQPTKAEAPRDTVKKPVTPKKPAPVVAPNPSSENKATEPQTAQAASTNQNPVNGPAPKQAPVQKPANNHGQVANAQSHAEAPQNNHPVQNPNMQPGNHPQNGRPNQNQANMQQNSRPQNAGPNQGPANMQPNGRPNPNQPGMPQNGNPQMPNQNQAAQQQNMATAKPKKKKKHVGLIAIAIVVIILVGGYFGGSQYYSKPHQVDALATSLSSGDTGQMAAASVDENGDSLNSQDLEELSALFLKSPSSKTQIKRIIQNGNGDAQAAVSEDSGSDTNFKVVQAGKFLGIYPKYRVQIKGQELRIGTNAKSPAISVDGNNSSFTKSGSTYKVANQLPGVHKVKVSEGSKTATKEITVPLAGNPEYKTINVKHAKKAAKETTTVDDSSSDDDVDSNDSSSRSSSSDSDSSSSSSSSAASRSNLIGNWTDDDGNAFHFNSDGSYSGDGLDSGTWKVTSVHGDQISVNFNSDGGQSNGWSTTFTFDDSDDMTNSDGVNFTR